MFSAAGENLVSGRKTQLHNGKPCGGQCGRRLYHNKGREFYGEKVTPVPATSQPVENLLITPHPTHVKDHR
jgi:hypothetical protein